MNKDILINLVNMIGKEHVYENEPMSNHTTFKIGGNADFFTTPISVEQIKDIVNYCRQNSIPFYVIGNGSNLLVDDNGYRGVIIQLNDKYKNIEYVQHEERIIVKAQAGVMLWDLGNELMKKSLSGFEFATGIPGTIGGAVMMNAGAYGGEIKDVLNSVYFMDYNGNTHKFEKDKLELGYRTSIFANKEYIILEAEFEFAQGDQATIRNRVIDLAKQRKEKQPLEYPSAGSAFKRPIGYFAGKLICDAGLVGYTVGGAQISKKHAGFVINTGNATASDIIHLTNDVKKVIEEKFGVELELEVRKLGFDK